MKPSIICRLHIFNSVVIKQWSYSNHLCKLSLRSADLRLLQKMCSLSEQQSVLAAGVISKLADVGFINGVQKWAVILDKMQESGLKLTPRQDSDLRDWIRRTRRWPCISFSLSKDTGRQKHSGSHSGWYSLWRDNLKLKSCLLSHSSWTCICNNILRRTHESRSQARPKMRWVTRGQALLLLDYLKLLKEFMGRHHSRHWSWKSSSQARWS